MNCKNTKNKRKRSSIIKDSLETTFNISNKKAKKTINKLKKGKLDMIDSSQNQKMDILIKSDKSDNRYKVSIIVNDKGIKTVCNCGERFGIPHRYNCKHISSVLFSQLQNYIKSIKIEKSGDLMSQLEDLFKSFNLK